MFIAIVKYSKTAIPDEYNFETKQEAEQFCRDKEQHNPYVRWTEVKTSQNRSSEAGLKRKDQK